MSIGAKESSYQAVRSSSDVRLRHVFTQNSSSMVFRNLANTRNYCWNSSCHYHLLESLHISQKQWKMVKNNRKVGICVNIK